MTSQLFHIRLENIYRARFDIEGLHHLGMHLALLVDANTPARAIEDVIKSFPLVTRTNLFDVYSGDQVPQGQRSLAYRIQFQSPNRTLTEEEVNVVQAQLVQKLSQETGARLRGVD